jgi:hypothetical protein
MEGFFSCQIAVSRILSRLVIYLGYVLPHSSSGSCGAIWREPHAKTCLRSHLLAADRVYLLPTSPPGAVGFYPTRFTLAERNAPGCFVSVALSLGLLPVAVSNCHSLRCPDFPPALQATSKRSDPFIIPLLGLVHFS